MKLRYFILILLLPGFFLSCKKKNYPESTTDNEMVFYFNALIDNQQIGLSAGNNNYYMYSSYTQNFTGVYTLIADLKQADCQNCPNSLQIKINDFKVSAINAPIKIDSSLTPQQYTLSTGNTYSVQFSSNYNKTASTYFWDFGDGYTSGLPNPVHQYDRAGKYKVTLNINGTGQCISSITNVEKVGMGNSIRTNILVNSISGNAVSFSHNTLGGTLPFGYLWSFGDGTTSTSANPNHTYQFTGSYPVKLRVIDMTGDTAYANYNVVTQGDLSSCASNFNVSAMAQNLQALSLSKIKITWIDETGIIYTSDDAKQPAGSSFEIISVEDFENNENGQKVKKVGIRFSCNVYNGNSYKTINNAEAVIAVAYR